MRPITREEATRRAVEFGVKTELFRQDKEWDLLIKLLEVKDKLLHAKAELEGE